MVLKPFCNPSSLSSIVRNCHFSSSESCLASVTTFSKVTCSIVQSPFVKSHRLHFPAVSLAQPVLAKLTARFDWPEQLSNNPSLDPNHVSIQERPAAARPSHASL